MIKYNKYFKVIYLDNFACMKTVGGVSSVDVRVNLYEDAKATLSDVQPQKTLKTKPIYKTSAAQKAAFFCCAKKTPGYAGGKA